MRLPRLPSRYRALEARVHALEHDLAMLRDPAPTQPPAGGQTAPSPTYPATVAPPTTRATHATWCALTWDHLGDCWGQADLEATPAAQRAREPMAWPPGPPDEPEPCPSTPGHYPTRHGACTARCTPAPLHVRAGGQTGPGSTRAPMESPSAPPPRSTPWTREQESPGPVDYPRSHPPGTGPSTHPFTPSADTPL